MTTMTLSQEHEISRGAALGKIIRTYISESFLYYNY